METVNRFTKLEQIPKRSLEQETILSVAEYLQELEDRQTGIEYFETFMSQVALGAPLNSLAFLGFSRKVSFLFCGYEELQGEMG